MKIGYIYRVLALVGPLNIPLLCYSYSNAPGLVTRNFTFYNGALRIAT